MLLIIPIRFAVHLPLFSMSQYSCHPRIVIASHLLSPRPCLILLFSLDTFPVFYQDINGYRSAQKYRNDNKILNIPFLPSEAILLLYFSCLRALIHILEPPTRTGCRRVISSLLILQNVLSSEVLAFLDTHAGKSNHNLMCENSIWCPVLSQNLSQAL